MNRKGILAVLWGMANKVLYNVTISMDEDIHEEWLQWMTEVHIPDVLRTGLFLHSRVCRIHAFEEGGISYAIQYVLENHENYVRYQKEYAPALQKAHSEKYAGKFEAFRTVLEIIHEQDIKP